jgi:folate-binding protein YgfZ
MTPAFFDLSARVKLRVKGSDCFRYLNGQITNDLRKATPALAMQASILSAKGKLNAHLFVTVEADGVFLLDADAEQRETLGARLDRYIIADDVEIEDVTDRFSILHFLGAEIPQGVAIVRTIAAKRFGERGQDLWIERSDLPQVRQQLSIHAEALDETSTELFRIEMGVPRWGAELTDEIIPVEADLEDDAIDYAKGCYIGQEVISRMKMSGQTNKRLRGLVSVADAPLQPGMGLYHDQSGKDAGWITSATRSARLGKEIGLGYVRRGFNGEGSQLCARLESHGNLVPVTVVPLPFA